MTKLFGSVEALTALLPLTNDNLETYNDNLDKQKTKTGQAEKATEDLGGTVTTQIQRIVNGIGNVARALDQVLGPALNRILSQINAIIVAANKAILALTDLDVGAANQSLAKGAAAISFGATSEGVDQFAASLDQLNPATARSTESLGKIRDTVVRVQEQLTRIRPEDINASTAVELQGKAQAIITAVDDRIGELKKLEEKVEEVVKPLPTPTPDPTPDPSSGSASSASAAADDAQRKAEAIADALQSSQEELAVAAQRLKVSQAATDLLADEESLNLRKLQINQRFDSLAKDALSTQQKQNIELTRELELRRASLDAQKGMMNAAQGEFTDFFKQQPEYAATFNKELSETDKLLNGAYNTIANGLTNGIRGLIDGTKDWQDILSDILGQLGNMALQFGFKMLGAGIGVPGFADGGRPPMGEVSVVGERGPELFVPDQPGSILSNGQSKAALNQFNPGNSTSIPSAKTGDGGTMLDAGETSVPMNFSYSTIRIADEDYVSRSQLEASMATAAKEGAAQGEARALRKLQMSPSARRKVGL